MSTLTVRRSPSGPVVSALAPPDVDVPDPTKYLSETGDYTTPAGASQTLAQTLLLGATTGPTPIVFSAGSGISCEPGVPLPVTAESCSITLNGAMEIASATDRLLVNAEEIVCHTRNSPSGIALSNGEGSSVLPVTTLSSGAIGNAALASIYVGSGDPAIALPVAAHGSLYIRADGANSNFYQMRVGVWVPL